MIEQRAFIVLGSGGHAKVVADLLAVAGEIVAGVTGPSKAGLGDLLHLGDDDAALSFEPAKFLIANGIGSAGMPSIRIAAFHRFHSAGFDLPPLVHPRAVVSPQAVLGAATQVMAGAIVQAGAQIGRNVIINTAANIDHDCEIADHAHIAPGAVLSGGVSVGRGSHIGPGATIIQGVKVGEGARVAAGAVVVRDVADHMLVMGLPAREVR